jgi:hydrid cluster protein-associated redox disulfide domain
MAKLIFTHNHEECDLPDDSPIAGICEEAGVPFACTEGVCGTCVIEVKEGMENLSPPTQEEKDFLGDDTGCERLACQCRIRRGTVKIIFNSLCKENSMTTTIHRQMTIDQILSLFPDKAQKLSYEITKAGLHCIGCQAATWETLEAGMMGHGMHDEQIDTLVTRLNALLQEKAKGLKTPSK